MFYPVAGRFDAIRSPKGVTAIVDYAHTPDALVNVLNAIHGVLEGKGKVITVVGAGGNRDKGKRPIMAKEAAKASDRVIITSDNPRFEEPQEIINDMLAGLDAEDMRKTLSIADRKVRWMESRGMLVRKRFGTFCWADTRTEHKVNINTNNSFLILVLLI